ncbi:13629_t:CDS:2 [Ambispora gerdemannii]|uniref:13629_t:CDS:1 n=1 Tax=Ambispora gerdemannii TaxID=144530 RepID=A0A9N8YSW4_9GLOM|nr:13629_t:CDS:2 [Ambispora gerdemannii]
MVSRGKHQKMKDTINRTLLIKVSESSPEAAFKALDGESFLRFTTSHRFGIRLTPSKALRVERKRTRLAQQQMSISTQDHIRQYSRQTNEWTFAWIDETQRQVSDMVNRNEKDHTKNGPKDAVLDNCQG